MGFIAKYPFLSSAKELIENDSSVSFTELEAASSLVINALKKEEMPASGDDFNESKNLVLAKLLIACLNNSSLFKKFADLKAKEFVSRMQSQEELMLVARDFFPSIKPGFELKVIDYLKHGKSLREKNVEKGIVKLDENELKDLLKESISQRLRELKVNSKELPELIQNTAEELREKIPKEDYNPRSFKGSLLALDCIQKMVKNGLPEGKRYYGSMTLAVCCFKDSLTQEQAIDVLKQYVESCRKSTHDFTEREAESTLSWVYKHDSINYSSSVAQGLGENLCRQCVSAIRGKK
ncbi:hypothetical protein HUU53_02340 [Candidatus Micrarchaeota archaeon]|nr:hypothetical protein [Candidatus Micrarchaeota archaeon]